MTDRRGFAVVGAGPLLLAALLAVLTAAPASAHGAPVSPTSRAAACGAEGTESDSDACRAALEESPKLAVEWDNVRVADVDGRDRDVIPDGELCSAGIAKFAGLDLPRSDWPSTRLTAGTEHTFSYRGTIPHEGTFRLYVTRDGYALDQPLTWADLEPEPFVSATDPTFDDGSYTFDGTLPADVTGRRLIYTIWQNTSTPDTYYSCSDVDFAGGGGVSAAAPPPPDAVPAAQAAPASPVATPAASDPVRLTSASSPDSGAAPLVLGGGAAVLVVAIGIGLFMVRRWRQQER